MSIALGWSIGANDAANSLGTAVGSRVLTLRQAIALIAVFGFLGAYLQGVHVTKTIAKGIVPLDTLPPDTAALVAVVGTFAACLWVVLATYWKMPISTSHSIVGAIFGVGLTRGVRVVNVRVMREIVACWLATPLVSGVVSYGVTLGVLYATAAK